MGANDDQQRWPATPLIDWNQFYSRHRTKMSLGRSIVSLTPSPCMCVCARGWNAFRISRPNELWLQIRQRSSDWIYFYAARWCGCCGFCLFFCRWPSCVLAALGAFSGSSHSCRSQPICSRFVCFFVSLFSSSILLFVSPRTQFASITTKIVSLILITVQRFNFRSKHTL